MNSEKTGKTAGFGVYVHFPWCLTKCPYCDFLSVAVKSPDPNRPSTRTEATASLPHSAYADAVLLELSRRAPLLVPGAGPLTSIFFGGGTPSLWDPREIARVVRGILETFEANGETVEVTAECNPTSLDPEHLDALAEAGVNRVSIGVQSLAAERLKFLGRLHDVDGGRKAVREALASRVSRVSADLIYGVYQEDPDDAVREVLEIARLGVSHLSAYVLTIEENTRFGALHRKGKLPLLDEERVAVSFERVSEALEGVGLRHYEVSNFARPGHESVHNRGYWLGHDYLGLGTGAFGTVRLKSAPENRLRYKNLLVPERYLEAFGSAAKTADPFSAQLAERETITPAMSVQEALLLGLRLRDGLDCEELRERTGATVLTDERLRAIERLAKTGRVEWSGGMLRIPKSNWLFADGIIRDLI